MRSPFKFLDSFKLDDRDKFFGRDTETRELYRQVLRTRLLLLYGLSGTGKSSLIQCGLAGEFDGPDWLPLWIRRQSDINKSLESTIQLALKTTQGSIPEQIRQLYKHYLRPVYLIFDQFEELFILGNDDERKDFESTLQEIMEEDLPCTVILVMREEYLGRLYRLEKAVPGLFDFRMRVERMETKQCKRGTERILSEIQYCDGSNRRDLLNNIITNISNERFWIELPYLQVYLDQLYRQDFNRTYPGVSLQEGDPWPALEFTLPEIQVFGTIKDVLFRFLNQQKQRIQQVLLDIDPTTPPETVKLVLDKFVSDEGTKRPIRYTRHNGDIIARPHPAGIVPRLTDTYSHAVWKNWNGLKYFVRGMITSNWRTIVSPRSSTGSARTSTGKKTT